MPALSFFADIDDVDRLVEHLNQDPEVGFLVSLDPVPVDPRPAASPGPVNPRIEQQRWHAVRTVTGLPDGQHSLWHVPAGALLDPAPSRTLVLAPGTPIADPWSGWRGRSIRAGGGVIPEVEAGPGYSGIVRLDLWTKVGDRPGYELGYELLMASSFQWIGSRYAPAPKETTRWWNRLKGWFSRECVKLTDPSGRQTFYAFPSALARLHSGTRYDAHNWDLGASINATRLPVAPG